MKSILSLMLIMLPLTASAIDNDKQLHIGASALMSGAAVLYLEDKTDHPVAYAIAASMAVGVTKELYDAANPKTHTAEVDDLVADLVGSVVGAWIGHGVYMYATRDSVQLGYNAKF